jgi:hypothetical protein
MPRTEEMLILERLAEKAAEMQNSCGMDPSLFCEV